MRPSYGSSIGIGAIAGLVLSVAAALFVGATGGVPKLDVIGEGTAIEPVFAVPASALWIVIIVTGAILGLILAVATKAISRVIDPDTPSVTLWLIAPLGAVVGAVIAFAVFPLGVTLIGSLQDGIAEVSVIEMVLMAAVAGLVGGAIVVWQSYVMARPPQAVEDPELLADDTTAA